MSTWLFPAAGVVIAFAGVVVTFLVYRFQLRAARSKNADEREEQRRLDRAEVTAAHTAAQTALATTASQLASGAYSLADRLQREVDRIRVQAAQEAEHAARVIADLRRQMAAMQEEIEDLRRSRPAPSDTAGS